MSITRRGLLAGVAAVAVAGPSLALTEPAGSTKFRIAGWKAVPARGQASFDYQSFSPSPSWNFPVAVPTGQQAWVTDMTFQSKNIRNPADVQGLRSSYAVFNSINTLTEHMPALHFNVPIILPAGFVISGTFINQSDEEQNMIATMHGLMVPV